MRITENYLRSIIKKELTSMLKEMNNTSQSDAYFKEVLNYLEQKGGVADKADFSYTKEEAERKGMKPTPPYAQDSSIRQMILRGVESTTKPFYSLVLNPQETDESKINVVNFYTYYDTNSKKNIVKAVKTTKAEIRNKYS